MTAKTRTIEAIIETWQPRVRRDRRNTRREYEARWAKVRAAMRRKGYDLACACGSELDRSDVAWLAGVYNRLPLAVQEFAGGDLVDVPPQLLNPYFKKWGRG
ncbi:MAG TPA: hypothetical protein ENO03_02560 [Candidatus Aminicenantes bacterium]|nr:hypothetical protein [Candidatus Aminicenantes bacterium]HDT13219.1 hypothetical protein [Candidatus Aminicenantes bacterium]